MTENTRILVVEDETSIRRLIHAALDGGNHTLEETGSGTDALAMLADGTFDLLILDLMLEDITGWQVLDEMASRGLRKGIRVMILTAQSAERDILRGWRMGVDEYCMKPFEPDDFTAKVNSVLGARAEDLKKRREEEIAKTQLLNLVDTVFDGNA